MSVIIRAILWGMLGTAILPAAVNLGLAQETRGKAVEMVRAKIGILVSSGGSQRMAKSRERLRSGDMLRVYVHPEKAAYVYVIYSDTHQAFLLNAVEQKTAGSSLVLPSVNESFEIDGTSRSERFTIVCSPKEIPKISDLFRSDVAHEKWKPLEARLIEESRVDLTEKSPLPFAIAGNVRGGVKQGPGAGAEKNLRIYSGKAFVVKRYEFRVKK